MLLLLPCNRVDENLFWYSMVAQLQRTQCISMNYIPLLCFKLVLVVVITYKVMFFLCQVIELCLCTFSHPLEPMRWLLSGRGRVFTLCLSVLVLFDSDGDAGCVETLVLAHWNEKKQCDLCASVPFLGLRQCEVAQQLLATVSLNLVSVPYCSKRTVQSVSDLREEVLSLYHTWRGCCGVLLFLYSVILTKVRDTCTSAVGNNDTKLSVLLTEWR